MLLYFQAGVLLSVLANLVAGQYGAPAADPYPTPPVAYPSAPQVIPVPVPGAPHYNEPAYTNVRGGRRHGPFLDAYANNYGHHHGHHHGKHHKRHHKKHSSSSSDESGRRRHRF